MLHACIGGYWVGCGLWILIFEFLNFRISILNLSSLLNSLELNVELYCVEELMAESSPQYLGRQLMMLGFAYRGLNGIYL